MTVNALNSGAKVWMADFEDATAPTWDNVIVGQLNLRDALDGTLDFTAPDGRAYTRRRADRRRSWCGRAAGTCRSATCGSAAGRCRRRCSTSGCTCSTAASGRSTRGSGPYFYLPKLE